MRKLFKVVGAVLGAAVLLILGAVGLLAARKPAQRPASAEKLAATPDRLARGEYLVKHVSD